MLKYYLDKVITILFNFFSKKKSLIIAIDFDNTIVNSDYPIIYELRSGAKRVINKLYKEGNYIIIWTCRQGKEENQARLFLRDQGVLFHSINFHHPFLISKFKNDTRKISADIYIDDKGMWLFKIPHWYILYIMVEFKRLFLKKSIIETISNL